MLTFNKNGNDSITMERTEMEKLPYYYRTEGVFYIHQISNMHLVFDHESLVAFTITNKFSLWYFLHSFNIHLTNFILLNPFKPGIRQFIIIENIN